MRLGRFFITVVLLCIVVSVLSSEAMAVLDSSLSWDGTNLKQLNAYINKYRNKNKLAVFDWDNTVIKNDIGDATMFYMLQHAKIVQPTSWSRTSRHLTKNALTSLNKHCPLPAKGKFLATSSNKACATAILCIYYEAKIWDGKTQLASAETRCAGGAAFKLRPSATKDTIEPGYAWAVALQAGHTPDAIRSIGRTAFAAALARSVGAKFSVGYVSGMNAYIRVYPQIKNLMQTLQQNKFAVWISTASSQYIVDAIAPEYVGVKAERVIGVKPVLKNGKITSNFRGCGTFADGQDIINFRQGKRCWINRIIFNVKNKLQQLQHSSAISFAAGDSDTDFFFLQDSRDLRLVINRNKLQVMCNALQNADSKWIINKMFIAPKKRKQQSYRCSEFKNVFGKPIPDQREAI